MTKPAGQQEREQWALVEQLLANTDLMKQMLVADETLRLCARHSDYAPR